MFGGGRLVEENGGELRFKVGNNTDYLAYFQRLEELIGDLAGSLRDVGRARTAGRRETTKSDLRPVLLAEPSIDLLDDSDSTRRYLEQFSIPVLPERSGASPNGDFDRLDELLRRAALFVQFLSDQTLLVEGGRNWAVDQYEAACEREVPVLQWRSPDVDPAVVVDPAQRALLQGAAVQAMSLEEFKALVRQQVVREASVRRAAGRFVLVDAHRVDYRLARRVRDILNQLGFDVHAPPEHGKPGAVRRALREAMQRCDAMLLVHGESAVTWVKHQLGEFLKLRSGDQERLALYLGPDADERVESDDAGQYQVIDGRAGIDERRLRAFFLPVPGELSVTRLSGSETIHSIAYTKRDNQL